MSKVFLDWPTFPTAAERATKDEQLRANVRRATHTIRAKRGALAAERPDWQDLRDSAAAVKDEVLRHLDTYLEQLEAKVREAGGVVHWAQDAEEANRIVTGLVQETGETEIVKVKSMLTEEIGLDSALEKAGISARETDLAAAIVQLGDDLPSHVVVPALHRNRTEIRDVFRREMGKHGRPAPENLGDDPEELAEAARLHMRDKFLRAKVAVSGANFMIAETGTLVIVESEGNGRMCLTLPETLISVVGIEKVLPTWRDLEIFLQLLARNATGERMAPYTSSWTGTTDGDGPRTFHLVLVDNGRTRALADPVGRQALRCIRCGACMNICPVYERTGGHAYGSTYPGPIGAVLSPQLAGMDEPDDPNASLPFASSLCGACYDACPVKIDIPSLLVELRHQKVEHARFGPEAAAMKAASLAMSSSRRWTAAQKAAGLGRVLAGKKGRITNLPGPLAGWTDARDMPAPPKQTFRQWWASDEGRAALAKAREEGQQR